MAFFPHLAEIGIERDEPDVDADAEAKIIRRKNSLLAEQIVARDMIKNRKKNPKASERIRARLEFDERLQSAKKFVDLWNYWRMFYLDAGPIYPKSKGQLTCIENIIEMAEKNGLSLSMLIATTHKAFCWRRFNPGFTDVLSRGLEYYDTLIDDVAADIDRSDYELRALQ